MKSPTKRITRPSTRPGTQPRILALLVTYTGCEHYRIVIPFNELSRRGQVARYAPMSVAHLVDRDHFDVIVLPRTAPKSGEAVAEVRQAQAEGKVVIYETDDDETDVSRCWRFVGPETMPALEEVWRAVDGITVSTPRLAKVMREYNENVFVLPNCVRLADWEVATDVREIDGLVIGLLGGDTHYEDWKLVLRPLLRIADEFGDVKFFFGGYFPDYFGELPQERTIIVGYVEYHLFPGIVRQIDVGLAPVNDSPFNLSKSGIKAIEYFSSMRAIEGHLCGIPVVASDHPIYRRVVTPKTGFLARTEEDWYEHIKLLIENPSLRRKMGEAGLRWVRKHRTIEGNARKWTACYRQLWRKQNE